MTGDGVRHKFLQIGMEGRNDADEDKQRCPSTLPYSLAPLLLSTGRFFPCVFVKGYY
jgi:hypothetical protein